MLNSITKEGSNEMKRLFGKSNSYGSIDTAALCGLFSEVHQLGSIYFALAAVYEMGRIDGLRQERARLKLSKNQC